MNDRATDEAQRVPSAPFATGPHHAHRAHRPPRPEVQRAAKQDPARRMDQPPADTVGRPSKASPGSVSRPQVGQDGDGVS
ncbi:hypothetical protein [Streptomyces sp. RKAG337]|uniref:hypothetical protein n=1 Tax=Streptomyces sp. RKAG337 TaxID=2893404 RepID=UPI00203405EF|nr:hypothetical protein [Streptomyces sp. RKAG337]MCM2430933.1 hypothetical protein [Streptomyces sp. RKAG337]